MISANRVSVKRTTLTIALLGVAGLRLTANDKPVFGPITLPAEAKGDILMARKMYREALDVYSQAPDTSATRWNKMGIAYHQLQDYRDARKQYQHALKLNPQYAEALNNLGTIYYAEKSYRSAIRQYKKSIRLMPESASVYSNLGTAYFARQDYKRASESYAIALKLDPEVFEHHSSFGVLLEEHTVAERAKFHYYLAKMYAKEGMNDRALQYIRKSLEEGFQERKKYMEEPEFAGLRDTDAFKELIHSEPRVL